MLEYLELLTFVFSLNHCFYLFQVKHDALFNFLKMMGPKTLLVVFGTMGVFQGLSIFSSFWLIFWTNNSMFKNDSLVFEYEERNYFYLVMYLLFGVAQGQYIRSVPFATLTNRRCGICVLTQCILSYLKINMQILLIFQG